MKQLKQAQEALALLDGDIASVNFDPDDPVSIEVAIQKVDALVDEKMIGYSNNPFVSPLIDQLKETSRLSIIEQAVKARLKGGSNESDS